MESINRHLLKNLYTIIIVIYIIFLVSFLGVNLSREYINGKEELQKTNDKKIRLIEDYTKQFKYYNNQVINILNYEEEPNLLYSEKPSLLAMIDLNYYLIDSIFEENLYFENFLILNNKKNILYSFSEINDAEINKEEIKEGSTYYTSNLHHIDREQLGIVTPYEDYYFVYILNQETLNEFLSVNIPHIHFRITDGSTNLVDNYDEMHEITDYNKVGFKANATEISFTNKFDVLGKEYFSITSLPYDFLYSNINMTTLITFLVSLLFLILTLLFVRHQIHHLIRRPINNFIKEIEDLSEDNYNNIFTMKESSLQYVEFAETLKEFRKICILLQRSYENKINEMNMRLIQAEEGNKSKTLYLANMSHEMRTPLNSIIGYTQLTNKIGFGDINKVKEYFECINISSEILLQKVNDILDLAKIESKKLELSTKPVELKQLVKEVYDLLYIQAQKKNIRFSYSVDNLIPTLLEIDASRLKQVLINLLSNAIKFTDKGDVNLNVSLYAQKGESVVIKYRVTDTGCGIPKDKIDKIFLPFVQVDNNNSYQMGTGLGLTIARDLIRLMGGDITVTSRENSGTIFNFNTIFKVSSKKEQIASTEIDNELFASMIKPLKILVAEDNIINQVFIKEIFKVFKKTDIDVVNDGFEAIEMCKKKTYDLILMDIQMPRIDGLVATNQIRHLPKCEHIKILALTANAFSEQIEHYLSIGMTDYLPKPIDIVCFKQVIMRNIT